MGDVEMSVCADSTGVEIIDESTSAQHTAVRSPGLGRGWIAVLSFMVFSLSARRSAGRVQHHLDVADGAARTVDAAGDAVVHRHRRRRARLGVVVARPALVAVSYTHLTLPTKR